jgi:hypothetical protein
MTKILGWKKERTYDGGILWRNESNRKSIRYSYERRGNAHTPHIIALQKNGMVTNIQYFWAKDRAMKFASQAMRHYQRG